MEITSFLELLQRFEVTALADVRSTPFSRAFEQFNRDNLRLTLREAGVHYVFLGDQLGGRPRQNDLFTKGVADYVKMSRTKDFEDGIQRLLKGAASFKIAMMCSEGDPLECHRCLLVGRELRERGKDVGHILKSGKLLLQTDIEEKLLSLAGYYANEPSFLCSDCERLSDAYAKQARRFAYSQIGGKQNKLRNAI